jgi:hypothetical protein
LLIGFVVIVVEWSISKPSSFVLSWIDMLQGEIIDVNGI